MYTAALIFDDTEVRLLAFSCDLAECLRTAHAALHDDPALLTRLARGGTLLVENIPICGGCPGTKHTLETYERTRASRESGRIANGPGNEPPPGPVDHGSCGGQGDSP